MKEGKAGSLKGNCRSLGECIRYLKPESVGADKADSRWDSGVFAGLRIESGVICVMTNKGVFKVWAFARKQEEEMFEGSSLEEGEGVPWEPTPRGGRFEVKTKLELCEEYPEEIYCWTHQLRRPWPRGFILLRRRWKMLCHLLDVGDAEL